MRGRDDATSGEALLAAAARGALALPGCASTSGGALGGRVVVVGGGYGGATAAKYLRMWSNGAHRRHARRVERRNSSRVRCRISCSAAARISPYLTVSYDSLAEAPRRQGRPRHGDGGRCGKARREARGRQRARVRPADPVAGRRLHVERDARARQRRRAGADPPCLEGGAADGRAAPAARGDARRRRLRDLDSRWRRTAARRDPTSARARSRGISSARSRSRRC